mgnify:CR=1 FL=1
MGFPGGVRVLLLSTYELGRPPFGLASAAAWLRAAGCEVEVRDLSRDPLPDVLHEIAGKIRPDAFDEVQRHEHERYRLQPFAGRQHVIEDRPDEVDDQR